MTYDQCPFKKCYRKPFELLQEKQYRIDHDFLKGPVCTFMGLAELFMLFVETNRYEEAKSIAAELKKTGDHLKRGITNILNNNVIDDEKEYGIEKN